MSKCEHGRRKSRCKECGGLSLCMPHGRRKTDCKDCSGSSFCMPHGRRRTRCKECSGSSICEHGREKWRCTKCGGSSICQHGRIKCTCKECSGSSICAHDKMKSQCKKCGGSLLCKAELCETRGISKYNGYCLPCCIHLCPEIQVSRNYKTKENDVVSRIKSSFPDFTWVADKTIKYGCSARRPDLLLDMGTHIVIVEVDENKHTDYDCSCENKRLMLLSQDVGHRPIVFIRFNPDAYEDQAGVSVKSCWKLNKLGIKTINKKEEWEERINVLKFQIQYWIDNPTEKTVEIIELFY